MQTPEDLTKERLIDDLVKLRRRIDELEKIEEEKQKYAAELVETKAMYEGLFQFAPDAILMIGSNGSIVQVNQQAERLFGYSREELSGVDHDIIVPDRFKEEHLRDRREYMFAPRVRRMGTGLELYGRRKDGSEFPVDIALGPLQASGETVTLAVVRDFAEHKQAQDKIARLAAFVEFSSDAIIGTTLDGIVTSWNPGAEIVYGYPAGEAIRRPISFLAQPGSSEEMSIILKKVRKGEAAGHHEILHLRKDGTPIDVSINVSPIKDSAGKIVGAVTIARDISERRKVESALADHAAELQQRAVQVEEINKELESFSYSVSHDLRAPLRAIDGYSRMILRQQGDQFDENTKRLFTVIRDNVKTMGQLIEDLLAFSRLGREALSSSRLNMEELIRETWEELKAADPDRPVKVKIDPLPPGMGDRSLIKQVLVNILANAVKFTRPREVPVIEVGGYATGAENVYYVRDNGVGFDMQYHDKLFGVFQRLHSADEYEGTGVGLAIVQRIVHRHGGRIWAESKPDDGACFYFTLPAAAKA